MRIHQARGLILASVAAALCLPVLPARAQFGDLLKQGGGTSSSGGLGGLGGALSGQTPSASGLGNVAGVLQFCIKNNYLSGNGVASVKDRLMGKLGGSATKDSGYQDGASGLLDSGSGKKVDLSGSGLKQQLTQKVCDKVLQQGKSLL